MKQPSKRPVQAIILVLLALAILFVPPGILYFHPIIHAGAGNTISEQLREDSLNYSRTLMGSLFGIPVHAQVILVRNVTDEGADIELISFLPPQDILVEHSFYDAPFWRSRWRH